MEENGKDKEISSEKIKEELKHEIISSPTTTDFSETTSSSNFSSTLLTSQKKKHKRRRSFFHFSHERTPQSDKKKNKRLSESDKEVYLFGVNNHDHDHDLKSKSENIHLNDNEKNKNKEKIKEKNKEKKKKEKKNKNNNYNYEDDFEIDQENWKLTDEEKKLIIPMEKLFNFRDLSFSSEGKMKEGMIFRGANLCGSSKNDAKFILQTLGIKTIIDMRRECERGRNKKGIILGGLHPYIFHSKPDPKPDHFSSLFSPNFLRSSGKTDQKNDKEKRKSDHKKEDDQKIIDEINDQQIVDQNIEKNNEKNNLNNEKNNLKNEKNDLNDQKIIENNQKNDQKKEEEEEKDDQEDDQDQDHNHPYKNFIKTKEGVEYHHIPLTGFKFSFEIFKLASPAAIAKAGVCLVKGDNKGMVKEITLSSFSKIDLAEMYKRYLVHSSSLILKVLKIMKEEERYPIVFYCTAGKDRTGIIAMFIQSICGIDEKTIIDDYILSEKFLFPILKSIKQQFSDDGIENDEFSRTPMDTIIKLMQFLNNEYGSVGGYLDSIGFSTQDQAKVRSILLK